MKLFNLLPTFSLAAALVQHVHDDSFVPDIVLRVSAANVSIGGIYRYTTLVNGTTPGPAIALDETKLTWIRVYNDLDDRNTTMHWHGLSQAAYPFSDGTPLAAQWPIPPHHFFDYEIQPGEGSAGTYFYHSHVGFQASSAVGPLIVRDSPPYRYDAERTLFISELWSETDTTIEHGLQANPFQWSGESLAFLVNGKGITNTTVTDPNTANLEVINVSPGQTYRFRIIGGTSLSLASMAFEDHPNLNIIEADGSYTQPQNTSFIQIGTGQRYSLLFQTKTCRELRQLNKTDFYFQIETRARPAMNRNYAILRYSGCNIASQYPFNKYPSTPALTLPPLDNTFLEYQLKPLTPNSFPHANQVTRRVMIKTQQVLDGYIFWQDDTVSWDESEIDTLPSLFRPQTPYLVSLYENQTQNLPDYSSGVANGGSDPATGTFPAKIGEVLEIILQNIGAKAELTNATGGGLDVHPWHAHGRHYYDAGSGPGEWTSDAMEAGLRNTQPVFRDTTMLYRYNTTTIPGAPSGWRAWRLKVEQPGVWMVHCHTLQHMLMGMQTAWVMGDAKDILHVPKPAVTGFLSYGGDVYGNGTHYPKRPHFSDDPLLSSYRA